MSTKDVPGFGVAKNDVLEIGVWAEHDDGSLILVEGLESGKVVYSIFDSAKTPLMEYRDSAPEKQFKEHFSFGSKYNIISDGWVWHDKTTFPWDKVMSDFKEGLRSPSVDTALTEATRIAERRNLKSFISHRVAPEVGRKGRVIIDRIQKAISRLSA